jgi:hypothetical protein
VSWAQLVDDARRRSTSAALKRRTAHVQLLSAAVFSVLAVAPTLRWLFVAEAVGQVLLALDNLRDDGDEVVYFRRSAPGLAAMVAFLLATWARCALALHFASVPVVLALAGALTVLHLAPLATKKRADLPVGAAIIGGALVLAMLTVSTAPLLAGTQFAYAAVLVTGVLALEPWKAELINVPIFAAAALVSVPLA